MAEAPHFAVEIDDTEDGRREVSLLRYFLERRLLRARVRSSSEPSRGPGAARLPEVAVH